MTHRQTPPRGMQHCRKCCRRAKEVAVTKDVAVADTDLHQDQPPETVSETEPQQDNAAEPSGRIEEPATRLSDTGQGNIVAEAPAFALGREAERSSEGKSCLGNPIYLQHMLDKTYCWISFQCM